MSCENKINFLRARIISYGAYVLHSSAVMRFFWNLEVYCECLNTHYSCIWRVINIAASLPDTLGENYSVFRRNVNK